MTLNESVDFQELQNNGVPGHCINQIAHNTSENEIDAEKINFKRFYTSKEARL